MEILSIQNTLLLIAGLINLVMSIIVFSRGIKNKINLYFGLLTFSNFLWALGLFLSRVLLFISEYWLFWSALTYIAALGIGISLFYFSYQFPFRRNQLSKKYFYLIFIIFIVLSIFIFSDGWFFDGYNIDYDNKIYILFFNNMSYLIYSIYFFVLIYTAIKNFYIKYKEAELFFKKQIKFLLITIIIGLTFGIYFDLILCYFGNFKYNWLGPIFTVFMNAYVFYLISSNKEKIQHG